LSTQIQIDDQEESADVQQTNNNVGQPVRNYITKTVGSTRSRYADQKKTSSFLANMNVNAEEPNAMVNLVRELAELNENLPMKARLSKRQIVAFAKAYWYAIRYNTQTLIDYCDGMLMLTVSEGGKGRGELVSTADAIASMERNKKEELKL
jgi:hypothetical protein